MKAQEIKALLEGGALEKYKELYVDIKGQTERFIKAVNSFIKRYGAGNREIAVFSVPGRSEISGNHTDHNKGRVLAGSIDRDIIAVAAMRDDGVIRIKSHGYDEDVVNISDLKPERFKKYSSAALIAGTVDGFAEKGFKVGGFDAYMTSEVLKGSGISSSAAYEVMIGNILNYFYNSGSIANTELAKIAKYAENTYFGKPCGLMDQMACAVGGFVYMDFLDSDNPEILPIDFSLSDSGYSICIVNTGGNHADLNEDYASVPGEMYSVAKLLGRSVLRGLTEEDIIKNIRNIRRVAGDRAVLRSLHFLRENERVAKIKDSLIKKDLKAFLDGIGESGRSSFEYLQNVYSNSNVKEQGLALALALTESYLDGKGARCRVHGGGFAGTIQVFLRACDMEGYIEYMDSIFGEGSAQPFRIRPTGATKLF